MEISLDGPDLKSKGDREVKLPKGKYFCFYNQISECLYHNNILQRANQKRSDKIDFYVIWDSYPFVQEQYAGVGQQLFTPASLKFDGEIKNLFRYILELEGQAILFQFSKSLDLVKVAWVSQGITVSPPGEEYEQNDE